MGLRTSVVVPVKDDAELLERCLRALRMQERVPDEVIVVDNGSSDDPGAVAARYAARLVYETIPGIAAAAAAGYDAATGDLLLRVDADTVVPGNWVRRVVERFETDPDLTGLTGPAVFAGLHGARRVVGTLFYMGLYFGMVGLAIGRTPLFGSNMALRSDAWRAVRDQVHRADARVHDDLDLAMHLSPGMRVRFDPLLLVAVSPRAIIERERLELAGDKTRHTFRLHPGALKALPALVFAPALGVGPLGRLVPPLG